MSPAETSGGPPRLAAGDLPPDGEFPDLLADRLVEEVTTIAAHVPRDQKLAFEWALYNLAGQLLGGTGQPRDISVLDIRIRRAVFLVTERLVMLFPGYRRHVGLALRALLALIDEEVILVGIRKLPPLESQP